MAKPNYRHQKKQREEQSRKKQEEKLQKRAARKDQQPAEVGEPSGQATSHPNVTTD